MGNQRGNADRLHWFFQPAVSPQVIGFCFFGGAYYLAYGFGMSFSQACASPFWFPDAVLLCALLLTRPRNWWILIGAALFIRLFSPVSQGIPTWFLLATFAIDAGRGLAVALLLRVLLKNPPRMETVKEFAFFCLVAAAFVPAVGAFFGAAALRAIGRDYWAAWEQWFMGDALVHAVLTPAILWALFGSWQEMKGALQGKKLEAGLLAGGLIATCWLEFGADMNARSFNEVCYYCPVPLLFWAAIRFGMMGASTGVGIITFFAVNAAVHGRALFYGQSPGETALSLQEFLLVRTAPLYLVAILIQQKENVQHSLRESEERFRNMADKAPVLIWMSGRDKLCNFFNQGWVEFTGRTMEQELGNGWADGVHPDDLCRCVDIYHSSFDARQPFEMEYRLRRHDGEYRWVLDRGIPRYAGGGEFVGYVGSAIDLTDRKRAEEARRDLVHASRLAVLGEFTAMIAHELNQPLSAILVNADAMNALLDLKNLPMPELRQVVDEVWQDGQRATEVIRRIRALVCKHGMEMQPLEINQLLSEVVRLAEGDALNRGVLVVEQYCENLPLVRGDSVHLQQVVLNLILNGMDAMNDNAIMDRRLTVSTAHGGDGLVEVSVRDNGQGIPPENLSRIFNSFFTTKQHGIGIGLSMARSIVLLHAGCLWAENNSDGRGTTFRFRLPAMVKTPLQPAPRTESRKCLAETR